MVMERQAPTSLCPMCLRGLKISTIEPHPTCDRVNAMTYRCSVHGDAWVRLVNQVELVGTDLGMLLPL